MSGLSLASRIYPVVARADQVSTLARAGARLIQLRAKSADTDWLRAQIERAIIACRDNGATLVVNDHWRLAIEAGASFVHLGQEDMDGADLSCIRTAGLRLGVSTHSEEELDRALAAAPDYVALGPIYPTTLKVMPWAPQGLERIPQWKRRLGTIPLVAIGGITFERAGACLAAGADCVAAVSDFLSAPDPGLRLAQWRAAFEPAQAG